MFSLIRIRCLYRYVLYLKHVKRKHVIENCRMDVTKVYLNPLIIITTIIIMFSWLEWKVGVTFTSRYDDSPSLS